LAERGAKVTGVDVDADMIAEARQVNIENISYEVAPADRLPFENTTFDAVTMFSAFHWFANTESIQEMQRVLRSQGCICIVNKNDIGAFAKGFKEIIREYIAGEVPNRKKGYAPVELLDASDFQDINEKKFLVTETYSLDEALAFIQSISSWNLISEGDRELVLQRLREYCSAVSVEGVIKWELEIVVQAATKP